MVKAFDLNTYTTLEHWNISHALRELIANALDETSLIEDENLPILTLSENGDLLISDRGRGLQIKHFIQNEDDEKTKNNNMIGKFGIGLKDAISVLHRYKKVIFIESKYLYIDTIELKSKHEFDVKSLHVLIDNSKNIDFIGTTIKISNISQEEFNITKDHFIIYSERNLIHKTKHGEIYDKLSIDEPSVIYINGIKVNIEINWLYHYNITSITKEIRDKLNRDRNTLSKSVYADKVCLILKHSFYDNPSVKIKLLKEFDKLKNNERHCDEIGYKEIKKLNESTLLGTITNHIIQENPNIIFATSQDIDHNRQSSTLAQINGKEVINIPLYLKEEIKETNKEFPTLDRFLIQRQEQIKQDKKYISYNDLADNEKNLLQKGKDLLNNYFGRIPDIKIYELENSDHLGSCDGLNIDINRNQLNNEKKFYGTLLHEYVHYSSKAKDETSEFEHGLTDALGILAFNIIKIKNNNTSNILDTSNQNGNTFLNYIKSFYQ